MKLIELYNEHEKYKVLSPGESINRALLGNYLFDHEYFIGQFARSLPVIGGVIQSYDSYKYYSDYNKNTGLKWTDYKYGKGVNMSGVVGALNFTSNNIMSLYK